MKPEIATDIEDLVQFALLNGGTVMKNQAERVEAYLASYRPEEEV